jgi:hypothetical protein
MVKRVGQAPTAKAVVHRTGRWRDQTFPGDQPARFLALPASALIAPQHIEK